MEGSDEYVMDQQIYLRPLLPLKGVPLLPPLENPRLPLLEDPPHLF